MTLYEPRSKFGLFALLLLNYLLLYSLPALTCLIALSVMGGIFAWLSGGRFIVGAIALSLPLTLIGYGYFVIRSTREWYGTLTSGFPELFMTVWGQTLPCLPK